MKIGPFHIHRKKSKAEKLVRAAKDPKKYAKRKTTGKVKRKVRKKTGASKASGTAQKVKNPKQYAKRKAKSKIRSALKKLLK
ncbi:hypothetical protein [Haladaptatus salinisoli]|uniref:hypothetical protein n=1 Tax=Haladaptatus salinisoli TaxID=2884876 RepID=UPI001D0B886B|nr:hypothetical protein [Haladaptatus salinisoli]